MLGGLPRHDLWLLPLIALATLVLLMAASEVAARAIWPEQIVNPCMTVDPARGIHYKPRCSATMKTPEGPWYVERFNDCGYRSDAPCGPLPQGARRIALLGTSLGEGYLVEYPDTIASRLEKDLSAVCSAPVQVQNLGSLGFLGRWMVPRMDEALSLKPQAAVLLLSPFDVEMISDDPPAKGEGSATPPEKSLRTRLVETLKGSRAAVMAQHFLFNNPSVYLPLYLRYGDKADFLRPPFSPRWRARLEILDRLVAAMSQKAARAHVPFAIAFVPQEAQVGLAAASSKPKGVDPTALPRAIEAIALRHGVSFIDTTSSLAAQPVPERLYYQVDGHLSGEGQPIAAAAIAHRLPLALPGFGQCKLPETKRLEHSS